MTFFIRISFVSVIFIGLIASSSCASTKPRRARGCGCGLEEHMRR